MKSKESVSKPLTLKSNSLWNAFGTIIYALTQWGILITIANFGTPEKLGIFTLALALTAPMLLLLRFNQRAAVATDYNEEFDFNEYFSARIITTIVYLIIMLCISIMYSNDFEITLVIIGLSFAKAIESISDILHGQMQKHERLDIVAKSRILKGIFSLSVYAIVFYLSNSLVISTFAFMFTWLFILIIYDFKKVKQFGRVKFNFKRKQQVALLKMTLPLGIAQLITSLNVNVPRYFLEHFNGVTELGFFASIIYIVTAGSTVIMAISGAIIPRLSKYYQLGNSREFIKLISKMIFIIIIGGIFSLVIVYHYGNSILGLLYTSEYEKYADEFLIFVGISMITYISKFLETGLIASRNFNIQPYINGITLLIISILSYILIPSYGIIGIAFALLSAETLQLLIRAFILIYLLKVKQKEITN